jgi:transposase-like protein
MPRRRHAPEQIIHLLREAEVLHSQGVSVNEFSKKLGIAVQTYYRWRREYGGLKVDQAKRLRDLEKENARLKRVVGELALDKAILKEAASGNF